MDRETEVELIGRLSERDVSAFDVVYDQFRARLYSFLVRLSRSRDVAEDLLEETWIRLVEHADRLKPDTRLGPWLFTVARNLYFSYCRSRTVEDERVAGLMGLSSTGAARPSPFEEAAAGELERRVERALAAMPPHYREVLLLMLVEDLTRAEMAEVCGVTPETLRQRILRARAMMAQELDAGKVRRRGHALQEVTV